MVLTEHFCYSVSFKGAGSRRGGVREHKGPRAGWFLLNAILAKCYNLAQDLADTAVNRVSLTGTQPDKCSQLQRRNWCIIR